MLVKRCRLSRGEGIQGDGFMQYWLLAHGLPLTNGASRESRALWRMSVEVSAVGDTQGTLKVSSVKR